MEENRLQSFKYWKPEDVKRFFGVTQNKKSPQLQKWLATDIQLTEEEERQLRILQERLIDKVQDWNEAELKFFFLGPLMSLIWFDSEDYRAFLESRLTVEVNGQITQGNIDFMVATGEQTPNAPFYTLHEYKPEPGYTGYPLGQLLIAMVAAQKRNEAEGIDLPLYGTYVMGRFFFFVYFYKNQYAQSLAYDATQEDIFKVYGAIKKVKSYIDENLKRIEC
ncbi:MAG: hypothetical protein AAGG68_03750 [Bacteroidota bacterium]